MTSKQRSINNLFIMTDFTESKDIKSTLDKIDNRSETMMIQTFKSILIPDNQLRVLNTATNPMYIGSDLAKILRLEQVSKMIDKQHCFPFSCLKTIDKNFQRANNEEIKDDEIIVNHSGFVKLINKSENVNKYLIRNWVNYDILPYINNEEQFSQMVKSKKKIYYMEQHLKKNDDDTEISRMLQDEKLYLKSFIVLQLEKKFWEYNMKSCIYILYPTFKSFSGSCKYSCEIGFTSDMIDVIQSVSPKNKMMFLAYIDQPDMIENDIVDKFKSNIKKIGSRKYASTVDLTDVIDYVKLVLKILDVKVRYEDDLKIYNDYLSMEVDEDDLLSPLPMYTPRTSYSSDPGGMYRTYSRESVSSDLFPEIL